MGAEAGIVTGFGYSVSKKQSEFIDKLVLLAGGDIELVNKAVRATATLQPKTWRQRACWVADLIEVVAYIVQHRRQVS